MLLLEALVRVLVKGRRCFYDGAFCAFVIGPFVLLYQGFSCVGSKQVSWA